MSPDDASIPLFRLTREVRMSALPTTLKKKKDFLRLHFVCF